LNRVAAMIERRVLKIAPLKLVLMPGYYPALFPTGGY